MKHKMYYYRKSRGSSLTEAAKCRCGAELVGAEQIAAHEKVVQCELAAA